MVSLVRGTAGSRSFIEKTRGIKVGGEGGGTWTITIDDLDP